MAFTPYTWIFALAVITAFIETYGIGANDLANAFGTSVGSKALKYWQAVLVASIFEFLGAVLLGANNTETMKAGVANVAAFTNRPEIFMYGMWCTMVVGSFWDIFSCTLELQVSTTHTTAGAIIGMALVTYGKNAVIWYQHTTTFPYMKGVSQLFLGWVTSPILASACASILFFLLRFFVLRAKDSHKRAVWVMPAAVCVTTFTITFTVIQTGNKNATWSSSVPNNKIAWISVIVGIGCGVVAGFAFIPVMKRYISELEAEREEAEAAAAAESGDKDSTEEGGKKDGTLSRDTSTNGRMKRSISSNSITRSISQSFAKVRDSKTGKAIAKNRVFKWLTYGINYDIHSVLDEGNAKYNETAVAIHQNAEVFDYRAEAVFRYIQVFTACVMSFAHGANDVANAIGPFSGVYYTWHNAKVPASKVKVETWMLAYGGCGIVVGLATYGWHIMGLFGVKSVMVTPTRGFCIELSTAIVVIVAARFGIPVSTSHICVFAAVSVGAFEGWRGVNWLMVLQTIMAMFITLGTAMGLSAGLTSFGVYSPQKNVDSITCYPGGSWQLSTCPKTTT